jgi:hypothetical protein
MAQYGYSAGYQGGGPQAVPSGFIEAYAQAGRNIGAGIQSAANAIGESLQRYGQNKEENQFLTSRLESLAPYLKTVAQGGNIMDKNTPESKLLGDIEKFSSMSIPQKKATLLNAEFFLDRADKAKAREMTDAALAQQLKLGQYNINAIESKLKQDEILSGAIQFGSNQPTTTTQTEQVTDTINFPPMPGKVTPAVMATPSQAEATAARYYMGKYGQAAKDLQQYGSDIGAKANALDVSQIRRFTGPISLGQEDPEAYINQQFESPIVAAARIEANTRLKQQQLGESQAAMQQAGIMSRSPALQTIGQRTLQPAQETPPIQQPPETRTRNVSTQVPISYEDQSKRLTQYLVQQGAKPETLAMVPQILSMVGQRIPTRVEQVGNIGSIVSFGGNQGQFVPKVKTDIGDTLKIKGLTIDSPEFQGTAPTEAEAKDFREQYQVNLDLRHDVVKLIALAKLGKLELQTPQIKAEAQGISRAIKATMRKDILGAGVVSEPDQKILDSVIPDPTVLFSWPSANIKALEGVVSRATSKLESKAKTYGLESVSINQSKQPQSSTGRFTIVPGKGIQPIQ